MRRVRAISQPGRAALVLAVLAGCLGALPVVPPAVAALVETKIESNVDKINENRPGEVALVLTNPGARAARVDEIDIAAPNQIDVSVLCPTGVKRVPGGTRGVVHCPLRVGAGSQEALGIRLETGNTVTPGPRSLVLTTRVSSGRLSASVVATSAFEVDIFAESDVLKAVGVPIFLLLPGVIVVLVASFLIRRASPWRRVAGDAGLGGVISTATVTAVVGLGVSLVIAAIYPTLSDFVPGTSRDYLRAYGFRDFYYVFGWSFAIAAAVWAGASLAYRSACWLLIPMPGDEAKALLRKVAFRAGFGGPAVFRKVNVEGGKGGLRLGERPGDKTLVAPVVQVGVDDARARGLRGKIEEAGAARRVFELWRLARKAVQRGGSIGYRKEDVDRPQLVDSAKVTATPQELPIMEATSA